MARLIIDFVRHGAKLPDPDHPGKYLDQCSEHGVEQVLATVDALLVAERELPAVPRLIVHSDMERTRQCAMATKVLFQQLTGHDVEVIEDSSVGFRWVSGTNIPQPNFEKVQAELRDEHGENLQFAHWIGRSDAAAFMGAMCGSTRTFALALYEGFSKLEGTARVLVFSHSPLCESLSPNTEIGMLGTADAYTYVVEANDNGKPTISVPTRTNCPIENGLD